MAVSSVAKQVIYLIERLPPSKPEGPSKMDKSREIAGTILALVGLSIMAGSAAVFAAHLLGSIWINTAALHTLFMTGLGSSIGGFHLEKAGTADVSLSFTV